ncbi:hypothetical protein A3J19_02325 [Candidatus Daviesbacteria bacterium RIFCSPLOWO2_02_FULL_41_8]|uniref:Uncharacterized protein n=2 Tax=Candidatus Daviesiibacteriota TaxID=1752718 RepID=A0A1F5NIA4_9BACT|nr:MAG: hypothetical protein A3D83_01115 [Candidatus Daviesbacteria bacterium RIFCSPHIGHO2_02_FULL_41_10]OGE77436.1 MAG: hypothetical protein A3J19_02325 [Candidatus Daviesbacteria bacterium RIFCSPLOWO2_02_FULL_41_8]
MPETEKTTPKRPNLYKPNDPPLFFFQITNPVTYFKLWFKKVWANEGIILHLRIKPLTIIIVALLLAGTSFGVSKYLAIFLPFDVFPTKTPIPAPSPTPNPWIETAFAGSLHKSENKFYLVISSGEAIALEIPANTNLATLVGKRILASGNYNQLTKSLKVMNTEDMEVLPTKTIPVPTSTVTPTAIPSPSPTAEPVTSPSPTPTFPAETP